jgi:proteasome lid subunit RPN8/RPN11
MGKKDKTKEKTSGGGDGDVTVKEEKARKARWGKFPAAVAGATVPLRVAMEKDAYAAITTHAAGSLDAEICGVLAGTLGEDDDGYFLLVQAAVRGDATRQGSTHVTFTHETWDAIHKTMEKEHPKLDIVGWYHSHPGFGVEFSEMDLFIQKNFFAANTQVAFVIDPLGGKSAMCLHTDDGVKYIDRLWVDGREMKCYTPAAVGADEPALVGGGASPQVQKALEDIEKRLTQALQAVDDQRAWIYRTITTFGLFIVTAVVVTLGMMLYKSWSAPLTPPKVLTQDLPIPIMVEGKPMILQIGVTGWRIPDELNAAYVQVERERREALDKARRDAAAAATQPSSQPATQPAVP